MEEKKSPGGEFIDAVCAKVRFKPARQQIAQELQAHLEDRAAMLEAHGVTPEDTAARAVAAMGDPEEIGTALDREHSPLWGWAAVWTFVARCIVAFFVLIAVMLQVGQPGFSHAFFNTSRAGFISPREQPLMTVSLGQWYATEHLLVRMNKAEVYQYAGPPRVGSLPPLIGDYTVEISYTQWYRNPFLRTDRQYVTCQDIWDDETGAHYPDGILGDARPQTLYLQLSEPDGEPFVVEVPLDWEEVNGDV